MTTDASNIDPEAPPDLVAMLASAEVVVFASGLTDVRRLRSWLEHNGVDYRVVVMGMGSAAERERFHRLRAWTGWSLLPQVFVDGGFVGGADEYLDAADAGPD